MSKAAKIALIFAIAAVAIAAKQFVAPVGDTTTAQARPASISPAELTRWVGPLEETRVDIFN